MNSSINILKLDYGEEDSLKYCMNSLNAYLQCKVEHVKLLGSAPVFRIELL